MSDFRLIFAPFKLSSGAKMVAHIGGIFYACLYIIG